MKAAVLIELNSELKVANVELTDLKYGQVLVKNIVSGICGSQLHEIKGNKGNGKFLPHLLGHEGYGVVTELGEGVTHVSVGDNVIMHWRPGAGVESDFPSYIFDGKNMSSGKVTTLSEFSIVSENRVTRVPNDTNPEFGALLGCGLSTALGVIENDVNLLIGQEILIVGTGGVGLNLIQASLFAGGVPTGLDINKEKASLVNSVGAKFTTSFDKEWDVIVDTTGRPEVINKAFQSLKGGGKLILVGQPEPDEKIYFDNALSFFDGSGKIVKASQGGGFVPQRDIPRYLKKGKYFNMNVVTHRFNLNEINKAFDLLQNGTAGRIMIGISNG